MNDCCLFENVISNYLTPILVFLFFGNYSGRIILAEKVSFFDILQIFFLISKWTKLCYIYIVSNFG